jgi:hypothetical protein
VRDFLVVFTCQDEIYYFYLVRQQDYIYQTPMLYSLQTRLLVYNIYQK